VEAVGGRALAVTCNEIQLMPRGVREWVQQAARSDKGDLRAASPAVILPLLRASAVGPLLIVSGIALRASRCCPHWAAE